VIIVGGQKEELRGQSACVLAKDVVLVGTVFEEQVARVTSLKYFEPRSKTISLPKVASSSPVKCAIDCGSRADNETTAD